MLKLLVAKIIGSVFGVNCREVKVVLKVAAISSNGVNLIFAICFVLAFSKSHFDKIYDR